MPLETKQAFIFHLNFFLIDAGVYNNSYWTNFSLVLFQPHLQEMLMMIRNGSISEHKCIVLKKIVFSSNMIDLLWKLCKFCTNYLFFYGKFLFPGIRLSFLEKLILYFVNNRQDNNPRLNAKPIAYFRQCTCQKF